MKTPVEIKISREGAITINVDIMRQSAVKASAASAPTKEAQDLELALMTVDEGDESKVMELNMSVLKYAESALRSGRKRELLEFLNKNKHRFNADLKDWLKDAITSAKGK